MTMNNSFEKALSLQLNGRPIGILQPRENQQEFNFPCSWLKDRGNNIFAQPASGQPFQTNTLLESVNLNWQIETPKSKIKLRSHKVFSTTKGELRSLIWIDLIICKSTVPTTNFQILILKK